LVQKPTVPARLQAWQAPAQPVLQHTPSTHCPDAHWLAAVQPLPVAFRAVQVPPLQ
jgi:hypothetical protein